MLQRLRKFVHLHHIWITNISCSFIRATLLLPFRPFLFISPINRKKLQESLPEAYHSSFIVLFRFKNNLVVMYQTQLFFRYIFYIFIRSNVFFQFFNLFFPIVFRLDLLF